MTSTTLKQRFFAKVTLPNADGCMVWAGGKVHNGYGVFSNGRRQVYAHRWSYEMWVGPIPDGLQLDHLCRVRDCVAPAHLEPVTARENLLRGDTVNARNAAKTHCPNGHELAGANLRKADAARGRRQCETCHREYQRRYRAGKGGRAA